MSRPNSSSAPWVALLLAASLSWTASAQVPEAGTPSQEAARKQLAEIREAVGNAEQGVYGDIPRRKMEDLRQAAGRMEKRLAQGDIAALGPGQLAAQEQDRQLIDSIVRADDKTRLVCHRIKVTGTRFAKRECMTVDAREARARAARENTDRMQNPLGCRRDMSGNCM